MNRFICIALLTATGDVGTYAQAPSFKWGAVRPDELAMTEYPPDSNAVAVILAEQGRSTVDEQGGVVFRFFRRVKILSEAAYDPWGTVQLGYWTGDYPERLDKIRALSHWR
jgi:hypothetical protein